MANIGSGTGAKKKKKKASTGKSVVSGINDSLKNLSDKKIFHELRHGILFY